MSPPPPSRAQRAAHQRAVRRVVRRLRPHSYARGYASGKLRLDPAYRAIAETLEDAPLPLLDIGCGMGLLGLYLHERGLCHDYLGMDTDPRKLRDGNIALAGLPGSLRLRPGDAAALPPHCGHVVLLDVLHYMPAAAQRQVLHAAAARIAANGVLLIRTCLADRSWRCRVTRAEERLLHAFGWMQNDGSRRIPSREQIEAPLRAHGLRVTSAPLWGLTPFNSYLFTARPTPAISAA